MARISVIKGGKHGKDGGKVAKTEKTKTNDAGKTGAGRGGQASGQGAGSTYFDCEHIYCHKRGHKRADYCKRFHGEKGRAAACRRHEGGLGG